MPTPSIHGHKLLNHILDLGGSEPLDALRLWAASTHGPDAQYHTCSAEELTFDSLMQFLLDRNKIEISDNRVRVIADHVCSHDDDHSVPDHGAHP
jgi:probable metal-binding protein